MAICCSLFLVFAANLSLVLFKLLYFKSSICIGMTYIPVMPPAGKQDAAFSDIFWGKSAFSELPLKIL